MRGLQIATFDADTHPDYLDDLIRLDQVCMGNDRAWARDNFLLDLPQKAQLSKVAIIENKVIGFIIGSSYWGKGHIHRLAVDPLHQRSGVGRRLLVEFSAQCLELGIEEVTVEVRTDNKEANRFYRNNRFSVLANQQLEDYLLRKKKDAYPYVSRQALVYLVPVRELLGNKR